MSDSSNSPCSVSFQPQIHTHLDPLEVHSSLETNLIRQEEFVVFWRVLRSGGVIGFLTIGFWARSPKGLGDNRNGKIPWQTLKITREHFISEISLVQLMTSLYSNLIEPIVTPVLQELTWLQTQSVIWVEICGHFCSLTEFFFTCIPKKYL